MLKIVLIMTALCLICSGEASALIENESLGGITVSISGAKRTRPRYIESLVENCLERGQYKNWEDLDAEQLGQCISNSRIFSKVDVRIDQPLITVDIAERWTLIPLPFFYASDDKRAGGIFIYETNFLGYGKTAGVGASVSTEGNSFSLRVSDPSVNFTDYSLSVIAYNKSTELNAYDGKDVIDAHEKKEAGVFIMPGYRLTPAWRLSSSLNYTDSKYAQVESYAVPDDYSSFSAGVSVAYDNADYKLFYNEGTSARVSWTGQIQHSDSEQSLFQTDARFEWDTALFTTHALQTGLRAAVLSQGRSDDVLMHGRGKGFRGIQPGGLWTREILAASLDYQVPVLKTGHGTFTVAPFADFGIYEPFATGAGGRYASYGIGAYYFINLMNMPGVGIIAGINQEFMGTFVDLQIGIGF